MVAAPSTRVLTSAPAAGGLRGELRIPGDKSISHRSLMFAALADGTSEIDGMLEGDDCLATADALRAMGVVVERRAAGRYRVHGVGLHGLSAPSVPLDLGNSGTGMRLFCGMLAPQKFPVTLIGDASLSSRPMRRVTDPLTAMGARIKTTDGCAPIAILPAPPLAGLTYTLPVASAQLKSALLIAGLYAASPVTVIEPGPSRDHTERMLAAMGASVRRGNSQVTIEPAAALSPVDVTVPADLSSAAFFLVAAAITPGSDVVLPAVGTNPTRRGVLDILDLMGADIELTNPRDCGGEPVADLRVRAAPLRAADVPASLVPLAIDEFPILFVAAAAADGVSEFHGLAELRHKESDRIAAMTAGLAALGVRTEEGEDWVRIHGGPLGGGEIESRDDHRIAMAFAVAGAIASAPVRIREPDNIATSFPDFIALANQAGLQLHLNAE